MTGSGKTTLRRKLQVNHLKARAISTDLLWKDLKNENKKMNSKEIQDEVYKVIMKYVKNNERLIIEGIDLIYMYGRVPGFRSIMLNESMIILGLSAIKAGIRAGMRNKKEGEGWRELYWMSKWNVEMKPMLKAIRDHVQSIPNKEVREYTI
jgi:hypothetical protein